MTGLEKESDVKSVENPDSSKWTSPTWNGKQEAAFLPLADAGKTEDLPESKTDPDFDPPVLRRREVTPKCFDYCIAAAFAIGWRMRHPAHLIAALAPLLFTACGGGYAIWDDWAMWQYAGVEWSGRSVPKHYHYGPWKSPAYFGSMDRPLEHNAFNGSVNDLERFWAEHSWEVR